jgi:hypothetical protein
VVVDVVATTTLFDVPPGTPTGVAENMLHVAGLVGLVGVLVTAQVISTLPVNEFTGVMVIVAVLFEVAPAWKLIGPLLLSVKLGTPRTVTLTAVEPVTFPVAASLPVIVAV